MSTRGPRYSEAEARAAVAAARSHYDALVRLGVRPAGGNHATLKKYLALWGISADHFDWGGARPPGRGGGGPATEGRGDPARRGPRGGIDLRAQAAEVPARRSGPQGASVRDVWTGRDGARCAHGAGSRPRQRCVERQSPREPPLPVPELQCDAGHALRTQEQTHGRRSRM